MKYNYFLGFALALLTHVASAQQPQSISDQTVLGKYTAEKSVENIVGSVYLYDDWRLGDVTAKDGRVFNKFKLKYNLVDDKLIYKGENDQIMEFVPLISQFSVPGESGLIVFKNGYGNVGKNTAKTFYQVLFADKIQAIKKVNKTVIEAQNYNSPSVVKNVDEQVHYYFVRENGEIVEFKANKKGILSVLSNKSAEMSRYLTANNVDFKNDEDLSGVFKYYNSIL